MIFKIATSLLVACSLAQTALADAGGPRGAGDRSVGDSGREQSGDRPFSGGPNFDRPGFPGDHFEPEWTTITCDADYDCELPNGEAGNFVCRGLYHPITGKNGTRPVCIRNERAWTTDDCGCCGEGCPEQPAFIELDCDNEPSDLLDIEISRAAAPGDQAGLDLEVVCREVTNPFTGEDVSVTLPVPQGRGLTGDTCGCCNDECPERGDQTFPRPDLVNITCQVDDLITCDLPPKREQDDVKQGLFVCRGLFNPRTGVAQNEALCIPEDRAWDTDDCGCCGGDCPTRPRPVDIECTDAADSCEMRNGEDGVFVCRSLFHPVDGEIRERSLCIPSDRAWVTDTCGCCGDESGGCPATPEGGFDTEDSQLVSLALETEVLEDSSEALENETESGASSVAAIGAMILAVLTTMLFF